MLGLILPWWTRWAVLAAALVAAGTFGAVKMHQHDQHAYDALAADFATFKAQVVAAGEAQEKRTAAISAHDELLKEEADHDHEAALTKLRADVASLRARRPDLGILPPATAGAGRADVACFDRGALESALRALVADVRGFVDEGSEAVVDLNSAKLWASERDRSR